MNRLSYYFICGVLVLQCVRPDINCLGLRNSSELLNAKLSASNHRHAKSEVAERTIWHGVSGGMDIRWTNVDLYIQSPAHSQGIWTPLAKSGFDAFVAVQTENGENSSTAPSCDYERRFKVLSVVGTVLGFEDTYYDYCRGAHPSIDRRFTTVNLAQPGEIRYAETQDTPQMNVDLEKRANIVKLTDFFSERDILRAMLADPVVAEALSKAATQAPPRTLAELVELFADDDYELGDSQFELRPDFLTRFAFHHIEGDKVGVRIGLPPHYGANRGLHLQIGLLLPIPENLRKELLLADSRQQGFLMKDARSIAHNQNTKFRVRMRHHEKTRK